MGSIDEGRRRGGHPLCQKLGSGRIRLVLPEPATSSTGSLDKPLAAVFRGLTCSRCLQTPFFGSPFITKCFVQSQHWGVVTAMSPGQSMCPPPPPPPPGLLAGTRSALCLPRPGHCVPGHPCNASLRLTYSATQSLCPQSS